MADGRPFTEGEAYALVADAVTRETASLVAEKESLTERLTAVETERDAALGRATAAEADAVKAKADHDDFVAGIEAQKAQEAKRSDRLAKLAEVAPSLKVEDERADRIVAMSDEAFEAMVDTVRETAAAAPKGEGEGEGKAPAIPRQSAAFAGKSPAGDDKGDGRVLSFLGARRQLASNG